MRNIYLMLLVFSLSVFSQKYFGWDTWSGYDLKEAEIDYAEEADSLFVRMTTQPNTARKVLINTLILSLKTAGVWAKLDAFYVFAAHDSSAALLNWVKNSSNATAVNSPTFTVDRGFTGNGSSSYLNTNYTPSTNGVNFTQNSAHVLIYSRTSTANSGNDVGGRHAATAGLTITSYQNSSNFQYGRLNNNTSASTLFPVPATKLGIKCMVRNGATSINGYFNKTKVADTEVSTAISTVPYYVLAWNDQGSAANFTDRQISAVSFGGALSDTEENAFEDAVESYMDAVGAGVIP